MPSHADIVTLVPDLWAAGLERVALDVVEGTCSRFRHTVVRFDPAGGEPESAPGGFSVRTIRRRPGFDSRFVLTLAAFLWRERPRILHAHNPTALFYGSLAARLGPPLKVLYTDHAQESPLSRRGARALRFVRHRQTTAVAVAKHLAQRLVRLDGWPARRVLVIPNGVRLDIRGSRVDGAAYATGFRIGVIARISDVKDHQTIVSAFARARPHIPGATLQIVGDGPRRTDLESQVEGLGLTPQVRFLGRRSDVAGLLGSFDLFVTASRSEGLPLAVLEAMAAGCTIVCSDIPAHRELLDDGSTARFFAAGDADMLAERMIDAARNPADSRRFAEAAKRRALAQHSTDVMVDAYAEVFEELLR